MSCLLLDTSGKNCSVMLMSNNKLTLKNSQAGLQHGRFILQFCDELLSQAKLSLSQLSAVAFVKGPGSFTGVRIGASVVQGISIAHNVNIIALPAGNLEDYNDIEHYQREYLAPLAIEYWQKKCFVIPEEVSPVYLNDVY
jgi:tRNA threonylcarbamoyladenosine biosynthesis protein TsaB